MGTEKAVRNAHAQTTCMRSCSGFRLIYHDVASHDVPIEWNASHSLTAVCSVQMHGSRYTDHGANSTTLPY